MSEFDRSQLVEQGDVQHDDVVEQQLHDNAEAEQATREDNAEPDESHEVGPADPEAPQSSQPAGPVDNQPAASGPEGSQEQAERRVAGVHETPSTEPGYNQEARVG